MIASSLAISAGTQLGAYVIHTPLGAGGMGGVYRARDTRLGRTVAIKVLPSKASRLHLTQSVRAGGTRRRDTERRAHLKLYDIGHQDPIDCLVLEYLDGHTLADWLSRAGGRRQRAEGGHPYRERTRHFAPTRDRRSRLKARQRDADEEWREASRLRPGANYGRVLRPRGTELVYVSPDGTIIEHVRSRERLCAGSLASAVTVSHADLS